MAKRNSKQTSKRVASKASKILNDGRYSKKAKSVAVVVKIVGRFN